MEINRERADNNKIEDRNDVTLGANIESTETIGIDTNKLLLGTEKVETSEVLSEADVAKAAVLWEFMKPENRDYHVALIAHEQWLSTEEMMDLVTDADILWTYIQPGGEYESLVTGNVNSDMQTKSRKMIEFTPSMRRVAATMLLIPAVATLYSCDNDTVKPGVEVINTIDRTTDNPANRADFEKTLKPKELADGVATMDFDVIWTGSRYELKSKPLLDFSAAKNQLRLDAEKFWHDVEKCYFFYSFTNNSNLRVARGIPFSELSANEWKINLNSNGFNKYIMQSELSKGDPLTDFVLKWQSWYLSIWTSAPDLSDMSQLQVINPYRIWK